MQVDLYVRMYVCHIYVNISVYIHMSKYIHLKNQYLTRESLNMERFLPNQKNSDNINRKNPVIGCEKVWWFNFYLVFFAQILLPNIRANYQVIQPNTYSV